MFACLWVSQGMQKSMIPGLDHFPVQELDPAQEAPSEPAESEAPVEEGNTYLSTRG